MYISPEISLMSQDVEAGVWYKGANVAVAANAVATANALIVTNAAGWSNAVAATMAVVAGVFTWVAGAVAFNSGVMPIVE